MQIVGRESTMEQTILTKENASKSWQLYMLFDVIDFDVTGMDYLC